MSFTLQLPGTQILILRSTTYGMGTAAMMLRAALLWTYTSLYSVVSVCTAFHAAFLPLLVYVLPFTLLLG